MFNKVKIALASAVLAGGMLAGVAAKADTVIYYPHHHHHHWMHARAACVNDGGFWTPNGCSFDSRASWRYRTHRDYDYPIVTHSRGYWRNGIWIRL